MTSLDSLPKYGNYIDGKVVPPSSGQYFPTENPFDGQAWALIGRGSKADVDAAVAAADRAFNAGAWPALSATQRGHMLWKLGDLIIANAERLAEIERRD
ncbi:aldehyde dehydrogenase family protein, partial [Noviherbaspirillum denitrificans]|uniref:aldehyde dehydrogenase family protein n=1 Tax=Noviherbaspirillum denitrificans TaxID=1968433 RepID=UPI001131F9EE